MSVNLFETKVDVKVRKMTKTQVIKKVEAILSIDNGQKMTIHPYVKTRLTSATCKQLGYIILDNDRTNTAKSIIIRKLLNSIVDDETKPMWKTNVIEESYSSQRGDVKYPQHS